MTSAKWRVSESRYLIEDRWLRLRADTCITASGARLHPYYVFEYPPWVTIFAVTGSGQLVLVRQYRHALREVMLELPGGRVDVGDASAEAAARRELEEETGYTGEHFEEIAALAPDPARQTNFNHVVIATGLLKTRSQALDHGEELDVVLMPLTQVSEEIRKGTFMSAMQLSALSLGMSRLGILDWSLCRHP